MVPANQIRRSVLASICAISRCEICPAYCEVRVAINLSGGDKLKARLEAIAKTLDKSATLRVGFLEGRTYPAGADTTKAPINVATVAAIQEFGAPKNNIPPRPFFRSMIAEKSNNWGDELGKILIHNNYDAKMSLGQMGAHVAGQLRQSIKDTNSPALAPATVAKKGFDKPLIDTGVLFNSVDSEVIE